MAALTLCSLVDLNLEFVLRNYCVFSLLTDSYARFSLNQLFAFVLEKLNFNIPKESFIMFMCDIPHSALIFLAYLIFLKSFVLYMHDFCVIPAGFVQWVCGVQQRGGNTLHVMLRLLSVQFSVQLFMPIQESYPLSGFLLHLKI